MKVLYTVILLSIFSLSCFAQNEETKALKKLNHQWIGTYPTKDTATLSRIFADDFILTNPAGKSFTKKEALMDRMSPNQQFVSAKVDTVNVRIYGNIGLVTGKASIVAKAGSQTINIQMGYLDVYEKRKGRWYALASQEDLISEQ